MSNNKTSNVELQEDNGWLQFTLFRSPKNNNINFVKNNILNIEKRRKYAIAEVKLGDKIDDYILEYFNDRNIDIHKSAFLSMIEIVKSHRRNTKNNSKFTVLYNKNITNTLRSKNYYNIRNKAYTLSKGYGKILLDYIEKTLYKSYGIKYIVLQPSKNYLISYYSSIGYQTDIIPSFEYSENDYKMDCKYNKTCVPMNLIMYKKLE